MGRTLVETLMGALVLFVAGMFVFISAKSGHLASSSDGYTIYARFNEVGSLSTGSDIRLSGIKIGSVTGQSLDEETYLAVLEFNVKNNIKLPDDSSAAIVSDGLLGGKYIAIEPGGSEKYLTSGGSIDYTQDAINLESLLGKFAFGGVSDDSSSESSEGENWLEEDELLSSEEPQS